VERLWKVLHDPETVANLPLVGKSYGGGAIKVEPRALEALPLSAHLVAQAGLLKAKRPPQLPLCQAHEALARAR
jgi:hypothetical protein